MFHGDADGTVSISDGRASRDEWVARLHCSTPPATTVLADGIEQIYPCPDDTEVLWREYSGQHHPWPTGALGDDLQQRMWAFHAAHPLPSAS